MRLLLLLLAELKILVVFTELHAPGADVVSGRSDGGGDQELEDFDAVHVLFADDAGDLPAIFVKDFYGVGALFQQCFHLEELVLAEFLFQEVAEKDRPIRRKWRFCRVENGVREVERLRLDLGRRDVVRAVGRRGRGFALIVIIVAVAESVVVTVITTVIIIDIITAV